MNKNAEDKQLKSGLDCHVAIAPCNDGQLNDVSTYFDQIDSSRVDFSLPSILIYVKTFYMKGYKNEQTKSNHKKIAQQNLEQINFKQPSVLVCQLLHL